MTTNFMIGWLYADVKFDNDILLVTGTVGGILGANLINTYHLQVCKITRNSQDVSFT